jgi:hypothetical protein
MCPVSVLTMMGIIETIVANQTIDTQLNRICALDADNVIEALLPTNCRFLKFQKTRKGIQNSKKYISKSLPLTRKSIV